jgi:tRNA-2-methylthio-N6-dimethylallyladenosine synthase
MRRGYGMDAYRAAVARLRDAVPGVAITTDIIVGFPGESASDFDATRRAMDEIGFDNAFIFKYSPRPGTPAADWVDDVTDEEKMRRNQVLLADQTRRGLAIHSRLVGTGVEVLVEGVSPRNERRWSGRTRTNKIVVFEPVGGIAEGDLVTVTVEKAMEQSLLGTVAAAAGMRREGQG